ncbi:MAG: hypothetical protein AAFR45_03975 [Pseudomonadota bacterium]
MSDPVTNAEIEDVLSSIRRLISDDNRTMRREPEVGDAEDSSDVSVDKLVLTEALRVVETDPQTNVDAEEVTFDPETPWEDPNATLFAVAETLSDQAEEPEKPSVPPEFEVDADLAEVSEKTETVTPEIDPVLESDPVMESDPGFEHDITAPVGETDVASAPTVPDNENAEPVDEPVEHAHGDLNLETDTAVDAADADATQFDIAEADEFADALESMADATETVKPEEPQQSDATEEPIVLSEPVEKSVEAADEAEASVEAVSAVDERAQSLSEKLEALEAAINRSDEAWEPDGSDAPSFSGPRAQAMSWQDEMPNAEVFDRDDPLMPEEDGFLDEESLRELVTDIVRQELQGALGERITRNVRKLVRREIHRALTAQELD